MTDVDADAPQGLDHARGWSGEHLTNADLSRLLAAAELLCMGDSISGEDLLQEALARHLAGQRAWNTSLPAYVQICSTMKSVLHAWRKARARAPQVSFEEALEGVLELESVDVAGADPASGDDASRVMNVIEGHFSQDESERDMLSLMMDGYTREEICDLTGWDHTRYATIKKRIQRKIGRLRLLGEI